MWLYALHRQHKTDTFPEINKFYFILCTMLFVFSAIAQSHSSIIHKKLKNSHCTLYIKTNTFPWTRREWMNDKIEVDSEKKRKKKKYCISSSQWNCNGYLCASFLFSSENFLSFRELGANSIEDRKEDVTRAWCKMALNDEKMRKIEPHKMPFGKTTRSPNFISS